MPYNEWVVHRYISLWGQYIFSWMILALYNVFVRKSVSLADLLRDYIPEAFMIQMTGIGNHQNSALWFVSAMFLASCVIYFIASKYYSTFIYMIAPGLVLVIYSYFYQNNKGLNGIGGGRTLVINDGFFRALAGLCVGVLAFEINRRAKQYYAKYRLIRTLYEIIFLAVSLVRFYSRGCNTFDFVYVMLAAIFVISIFGREDAGEGSYLTQMLCKLKVNGKYSFGIYCNHWLFTYIIRDFFPG